MRWGEQSKAPGALNWVRPLHSIVATFGPETEEPEIVPFSVGGIAAGNETRGHRFLAPKSFKVKHFDDYAAKLDKAKTGDTLSSGKQPHPPIAKVEPYPVAHFQSNPYDASGRTLWAWELIRRIKVASYGRVLPTVSAAGTIATRDARLAVSARHKFTLAFENSIAPDYVSDKLFDVWIAGSVPVYLGAPNVAEFAPAAHSYIDVADFAGPQELANFLKHLDRHDEEYEAYLEWKRSGPDARFLELMQSVSDRPWCEVVELAYARRNARPA